LLHKRLKKSYATIISLSTKNAPELPKCSKSLHFPAVEGVDNGGFNGEQKEKILNGDGVVKAGFVGKTHGGFEFRTDFEVFAPALWPLICSFQGS
jgi:hypothetical protein